MPDAAAEPRKPYLTAPLADWLLAGGLSIAAFVVLGALGLNQRTPAVWTLAGYLSWVCNWPHFSATCYRLYSKPENIAQYPMTALVIPVVMAAGVALSFGFPDTAAPAFVKLFLLWSPYHFSGQTLGVCLLYAARSGYKVEPAQRLTLAGFIYGTFIYSTLRGEAGLGPSDYYAIVYPMLGIPRLAADVAGGFMWASGAAFLALTAKRALAERRAMHPIILLPAVAQLTWFVFGSRVQSFYEFVPFFHSLQYLLVAWALQVRDSAVVNPRESILEASAGWLGKNIIGGAALFWMLPHAGTWFGYDLQFTTPVLISAVQMHHFFVDGVIWRLRDRQLTARFLTPAVAGGRA